MEPSAGGVEGALLILGGAVGDQRAAFAVESRKHNLIHRPFSQPRGLQARPWQLSRNSSGEIAAESMRVSSIRVRQTPMATNLTPHTLRKCLISLGCDGVPSFLQ